MAQVRYVTDELVITFRTGPSSANAITRNLTSGARVEVLEELDDAEGYSRVRLTDGAEGWVLTRYLQSEPTAEQALGAARQELAREQVRAEELAAQLGATQARLDDATQALAESRGSAERLEAELRDVRSASAGALTARARNVELEQRVSELEAQLGFSQAEITNLARRERQNWFLIGAAVLTGGIVIGLVAPTLRRKRRSSW